ncbi:DUF4179 domain-containing protein [Paenibacillus azoreducens]|uniref:DUF4179 domain-containing protein n=1 Tax=Paenibacillus azoreducens TaxID=116718 RepID=UPI0039F63FAF
MSQDNRIKQEIEKIEIPKELHERSLLGVRQAKRELSVKSRVVKAIKVAGITAAGLVLAVALGTAASPTFADYVKSWFSLHHSDEGLKQAADEGFAEQINKEVTDQGITFKVKEAIHDAFRISVLYGIERDGKPMDPARLFDTFIPNGPDDNPYVNRYEVVDEQGNVLPLSLQQMRVEQNQILFMSLDDLLKGRELQSMSDLPDRIIVRFDINQIGSTYGKWHLEVPIDLTKAKASTTLIPINKRYISPMGFSVDFKQLRHGPSKSEVVLQVNETQDWRKGKKSDPMLRYEVKNRQGSIVAAFDGINRPDLGLGDFNLIKKYWSGQGERGHMTYAHPFLPFTDKQDLTLNLTSVYWLERLPEEVSVKLQPEELAEHPQVKEVNGKSITFKARVKTEKAPELLQNGRSVFEGEGWILEADQQLGSDVIDIEWHIKDGQGQEIQVPSEVLLEQDAEGNDRNRKLFFFPNTVRKPDNLTLSTDTWTKKAPIDWSIPLVPSSEPLPPVHQEPVYEMTVEDLKPGIVAKAEQALHELVPDKPSRLFGVADYSDRWFLYARDNSGSIVIVDKKTAEPIIVQRVVLYSELDQNLRQTVEDTLSQMKPEQPIVFKEAIRDRSQKRNRWLFSSEQAGITIDVATGKVEEAFIRYAPGHFEEQAKAAAEQAYQVFSQGKPLQFTGMTRKMTPKEHVWELEREMNPYVKVGVRTNRVWSVEQSYKNDDPGDEAAARKKYAVPLYTKEQAVAKVGAMVQSIFGLRLEGYEMSVKLNEYIFTKRDSMTMKGTVNAKGDFWKLELIPSEGIQD